jgi:hypothetical protein
MQYFLAPGEPGWSFCAKGEIDGITYTFFWLKVNLLGAGGVYV